MASVVYTKLGEHRGNRRLWLEGNILSRHGIKPGDRFRLDWDTDNKRLVLRLADDGERTISKRKRGEKVSPVLDINASELAELFGQVDRVRVVVRPEGLLVTLHPHQAACQERLERVRDRLRRGEALRVGSLAHGAGVLDHALHSGLRRAGIASRLAFGVEIEAKYLEASLENNPVWDKDSTAICAPMQDVEVSRLAPVEILVAGLPCTGASLSGRAKNKLAFAEQHETAGSLFVAFLAFIEATQPAVVVLENVPPYQNTVSMHVIREVLESRGYALEERVLSGPEFGSLERRDRLCVVAATEGLEIDLQTLRAVRAREHSLAEILEPVAEDSPRWRDLSYLRDKAVKDEAAGKGFKRQVLKGDEDGCGTIGRGYAKYRSTEPMLSHPSDPVLERLFTPAEHAAVKTIPGKLIEGVAETTAHEMLGQSVIHCVFEAVGAHLGEALNRLCAPVEPHRAAA
ncbi:DNA cytosine methyltransferase [Thioalkalivibrio thiocyanodenitrificans]|uniref:DNA cytosine methyltransferase n=1 Tax=Thioalkalivibrio thiocyanodenitrificans TaxID=243063 RepID=UPI000367ADE5|nr:DNA cytosine methyltransferase [Thioalkalivibrio thiocyanodenitrificans]